MKIFIGVDHKGMDVKKDIISYLQNKNMEVISTTKENYDGDDYPDFALEVCENVLKDNALGILLCGTGIGMSIAANKVKGIRCAKVSTVTEARLAKEHNDANVLALSYKLPKEELIKIIDTFIETPFSNEERHKRRIAKINKIENENI